MAKQLFANLAKSKLAGALADSDTSLSVTAGDGTKFPAITGSDFFYVTIQNSTTREIVKVTARTSDAMTIVRGQEDTSAVAWDAGADVRLHVTAGFANAVAEYLEAPTAPDDPYDATTWNGNVDVPTKNAIRDKIESLGAGGYTDEQAQDAVGGILTDSGTVDFTYNDATPSITAIVKDDSITYAKIQNVSATDKVLGRATSGAGDVEEITCTATARSILDDTSVSAVRTTIGAAPIGFTDAGNTSTSLTIDWSTNPTQKATLTGNCTFTFANPVAGGRYFLELAQDTTGSRTVTWPTSVRWGGGTAPTLTTTATRADGLRFVYNGDIYIGQIYGQNYNVDVATPGFKTVTVDHTKVGGSDLTDFAFPFIGTYSYLKSSSNGGQIANVNNVAFYSDSGLTTLLSFERVSHNLTTGLVEYWVRIPTLSHTSDTVIYLGWDTSTTDRSAGTAVWTSNNWGSMVHHYGDATTLTLNDSTSNGRNGTAILVSGFTTTTNPAAAAGKIGGGLVLDGTKLDSTAVNGSALTAYSIAVWAKVTTASTASGLCNWDNGNTGVAALNMQNNSGVLRFYVDGGYNYTGAGGSIASGTWYRLAVTMLTSGGSTVYKFYQNGTQVGTYTGGTTFLGNAANIYVGHGFGGSQDAAFDEINLLMGTAHVADWFTADYNSQNDPSTFYSVT